MPLDPFGQPRIQNDLNPAPSRSGWGYADALRQRMGTGSWRPFGGGQPQTGAGGAMSPWRPMGGGQRLNDNFMPQPGGMGGQRLNDNFMPRLPAGQPRDTTAFPSYPPSPQIPQRSRNFDQILSSLKNGY